MVKNSRSLSQEHTVGLVQTQFTVASPLSFEFQFNRRAVEIQRAWLAKNCHRIYLFYSFVLLIAYIGITYSNRGGDAF